MQDQDKTVCFTNGMVPPSAGMAVTVFDGMCPVRTIELDGFGKDRITFGRGTGQDILLTSPLVSSEHGRFVRTGDGWRIEDKEAYCGRGQGSTNGLIYNHSSITSRRVSDGDFIRIDDGVETVPEGVLFVFSSADSENKWKSAALDGRQAVTIGREGCDITLAHISVSKCHAKIIRERGGYYIIDCGSRNGVIVNNRQIKGIERLHEKDVICITNSKLIFTSGSLSYCCYKSGISVDAEDIVVERKEKGKKKITCSHVSLGIRPGELAAIIGGSGAGKSTILNCMCGYLRPQNGEIYINGVDLYRNFDSLKKLVGYVPQSDIVYGDLTLYDMLWYTAKLRLPKDALPEEREDAIAKVMDIVDLTEKKDSLIRSLSGGQKKRASIAVELLTDPNLLFLDEPASGLDPGTERSLMQSLRKMADSGKTVILVTHSTLQLRMCDKIVFMGKGGNLCFCGSYEEALEFFGVTDIVDVYHKITGQAELWRDRFERTRTAAVPLQRSDRASGRLRENGPRQLCVLSARYLKLALNDRQRLLLLLFQAPLLAFLISLVADGKQFEQYEMTKSLLFALSCSAFWVGMLNAIQEICKERIILKREYMTGVSLGAYITSKIMVLGLFCLLQSVMLTGVFGLLVGLPESGVFTDPFLELLVTVFITSLASSAMGLFVSSLFRNADRAMTVAPILLMPQILFSGLIFKLDGATEVISWLAVCRWSMEGFGTSADLNTLPLRLQQEGIRIPHEAEAFFERSLPHMLASWGILLAFTLVFLVLSVFVLSGIRKERS